jgi:hypothetical protein
MARLRAAIYEEVPPPLELENFGLWCVARGEVDAVNHTLTGDRAVWRAERGDWLAARGRPRPVEAPDELVSYEVWCEARGLAPFGVGGDVVSLRAAWAQWEAWEAARDVWAAAHGCEADDVDMVDEGGGPFNPDI